MTVKTNSKKPLPFRPSFGTRPTPLVGRDEMVDEFIDALEYEPGHPYRATLFTGQRGYGKTAMLLELASKAEEAGYIHARALAGSNMLKTLIDEIQHGGAKLTCDTKRVKNVNIGAYGFSVGLTFNDATEHTFGFGVKLSMLLDELAKHGKGILLLIDEIQATGDEIHALADAFQKLVGEGKDLAIAMAGLPASTSSVLGDKVLTFLNRAHKVELGRIAEHEFRKYYYKSFKNLNKTISPEILDTISVATMGYPYLFQLIGFNLLEYLGDDNIIDEDMAKLAIKDAKLQLVDDVYTPALKPISAKDYEVLKAVASFGNSATISDITTKLGVSNSYIQQYRQRLLSSGLLRSNARGSLEFVLPYMDEFLRTMV